MTAETATQPRYVFAADDVCGILYRPGEMSIESLNHCRLRIDHGGRRHSTKTHEHDYVGFDWEADDTANWREWPS